MGVKNRDSSWLSNVGVVQIGTKLVDYNEVIYQMVQTTNMEMGSEPTFSEYQEAKSGLANFQQTVAQVDTCIGGCDVFNPYWQFGLDDDIIHPINDISANKDGTVGLGSVYSEMIYDTQRVLYLSAGVAKFSNLKEFFYDDTSILGNIMRNGNIGLGAALGTLFGTTGKLALKIAFWPISVFNYLGEITDGEPVKSGKYYDFKPAMPLYFRLVNSIFSAIAVSMGIGRFALDPARTGGIHESALNNLPDKDLPEIVREGPNIYAILQKRNKLTKRANPNDITDDYELLQSQAQANAEESDQDVGIWKKFGAGFTDGMSGANNFIGFRIEKSANATENISNDFGESEVAGTLNSIVASQRSMMFKIQEGEFGVLPQWVADAFGFVKDVVKHTTSSAGGNTAVQVATGNGYFDIPHEWKNSSFTKNQSFSIQLRARYGDPVSILQCLYLPFALILAMASPRAVGTNMYTSPFLVQAYSKGLFSIPMGMIRSVGISRGGAEFGWSRAQLPLSLDLEIEIQDLTPQMFISMTDNEDSLFNLTLKNTAMLDYISTLSGVGLYARNSTLHLRMRQAASSVMRIKNTLFSPYFWGYMVGDNMGVFKNLYQMSPWARGPEKYPPMGRF